jgi:hypothetical protein
VVGKIYTVKGNLGNGAGSATSQATCNAGDSVLSGGFQASNNIDNYISQVYSFKATDSIWQADVFGRETDPMFVQAEAYCFDNP